MKKIRIMMAEDHHSAREAYVALLADEPNFIITGEAANGYELLKLVEKKEPDIVLVDVEMPVMDGYQLIAELKEKYPRVKPIVLTMHDESHYVAQMVLCGARAYLPKGCSVKDIITAINRVYEDGFYFSEALSRAVVVSSIRDRRFHQRLRHLTLSEQEIDFIRLLCSEKSERQISAQMKLPAENLEQVKKEVYRKTRSSSLVGLIKFALVNGIIKT